MGAIMFLTAQLKSHRDALVLLLKASNLQPDGKPPEKYLEDKVAEQANELLLGLADYDPKFASFLADFLNQKAWGKGKVWRVRRQGRVFVPYEVVGCGTTKP